MPVTQLSELDPGRSYARIAARPSDEDDHSSGPPFYYDALHEPEAPR